MTFRARAGAAPLKPGCVWGVEKYDSAFRARAGAAPLKRLAIHPKCAPISFIPRPRGRGPVEADSLAVADVAHKVHSAPARARPR